MVCRLPPITFKLLRPVRKDRTVRYWYVQWSDHGRSKTRSTGCTSREDAEQWLAEYLAERSRPFDRITINGIIDGYLVEREDTGARSLPQIKSHLNFIRRAFGPLKPSYINRGLMSQVMRKWRSDGTSDGTIRTRLLYMRAALSWAVKAQWIDRAPHIEAPPPGAERTRYLSREEVRRLYAAAEEVHIRTFIALGVYTGLRNGAILSLKWSDVDRGAMIITPTGGTRTKRRAKVPINEPLALALGNAWINRQGPYVVHWNGQQIGSVKTGFHAAVRRAELEDIKIHDMRRTCASWLAIGGVPMDRIAIVLGDTVAVVQKHYAHLSPQYLRSEMDALAQVPT